MGHIIPAGTGFIGHRNMKLKALVEIPDEPAPTPLVAEEEDSSSLTPLTA